MSIVIFTGDVRSGKTTWLKNNLLNKFLCGGILTPDVDGLRNIYNIANKIFCPFEITNPNQSTINIGNFHFIEEKFQYGAQIILKSYNQDRITVIDEFGPLEFKGKGFQPYIEDIILNACTSKNVLIIVVRKTLVDDFKKKYGTPELIIDFSKSEETVNMLLEYLDRSN